MNTAVLKGMRHIDTQTLKKFDRPGPRYTSYPTAVEFTGEVGAEVYGRHLEAANARPDEPLSLYMHLPFCEARCAFCACNVVITPHMHIADRYLDYLEKEVRLVADRLPDRRAVAQMHWGGGTPTYYPPDQLERVFRCVDDLFGFEPDAEIGIEVNPHVTTTAQLDRLASIGFNRLSLGVQDTTPEVQEAITRFQSLEETRDVLEYARSIGFSEGVNVDLVYGLPRQRLETFEENLRSVIDLRPDRVALYSFAYVPWIQGHQKLIDTETLPDAELKFELYRTAISLFLEAGYEPIGMDHFALPTDELVIAAGERRLNRNFMGYTVTQAPDMVAFGVSGIGYVADAFFQTEKKLSRYYAALDADTLPVHRGYVLDADDRIRQHVIKQLMCNFHVEKQQVTDRFGIDFDDYFSDSLSRLDELRDAGFVKLTGGAVSVTPGGRAFVRNVCMAFDRHLQESAPSERTFSRTV